MNSTKDLLHQILNTNLSANERARLRCQLATQLEQAGNYEAARDALGELWPVVGERPDLAGLDQRTAAEVLLRTGVLTGVVGSTKQIEGSQELAKNLISESIKIFESLKDVKKVAEAQTEIAVCYGREGQVDNARAMLSEAVSRLDQRDGDLNTRALLRSAIVERLSHRLGDALSILTKAAPLVETSTNNTLKGTFYYEFANVLRRLGEIEESADYIDRSVIEYTAASFHFEQAGHARYQACVENNLALVYLDTNRLDEAHDHLDRAQALFTRLNDTVHLAQVEDTRARVMLAEGAFAKAEKIANAAVRMLEKGGEHSILAEALTTHGIALVSLGDESQARTAFERAIEVAEQADDVESAGIAALTFFEQLAEQLSNDEICETLDRAHASLKDSKNAATRSRLTESAFRALSLIHVSRPDWTTFSLDQTQHRHEARYIQMALEDAGGVISRAARLLGLSGHQNLQYMLKTSHKDLRNRSIEEASGPNTETLKVLQIEDDPKLATLIQDIAAHEGWQLQHLREGGAALRELATDVHYDVLLVDDELPGLNALEVVRQVRSMGHRAYIWIVMMSGTLEETVAREAGADALLRKPERIASLVETIRRLVAERTSDG